MVRYKRNVCTYIDIMATSWHCTHIKNQMTSEKCQKRRDLTGAPPALVLSIGVGAVSYSVFIRLTQKEEIGEIRRLIGG
jgi:hypothetical protein